MASGRVTPIRSSRGLTRRPWLALAALVLALLPPAGCAAADDSNRARTQDVKLGARTFTLELALDDATRIQGLSDRKEIAADGGMLFVFPRPRVLVFVMRRCLVPIDIIFLSPTGRIVRMHEMQVEPYERTDEQLKPYPSEWPAQFAIELRGGTIRGLGLQPGQAVELPLSELKRRAR